MTPPSRSPGRLIQLGGGQRKLDGLRVFTDRATATAADARFASATRKRERPVQRALLRSIGRSSRAARRHRSSTRARVSRSRNDARHDAAASGISGPPDGALEQSDDLLRLADLEARLGQGERCSTRRGGWACRRRRRRRPSWAALSAVATSPSASDVQGTRHTTTRPASGHAPCSRAASTAASSGSAAARSSPCRYEAMARNAKSCGNCWPWPVVRAIARARSVCAMGVREAVEKHLRAGQHDERPNAFRATTPSGSGSISGRAPLAPPPAPRRRDRRPPGSRAAAATASA